MSVSVVVSGALVCVTVDVLVTGMEWSAQSHKDAFALMYLLVDLGSVVVVVDFCVRVVQDHLVQVLSRNQYGPISEEGGRES